MELRHLRHLTVLAETGSFHKAARQLGLRQPALSQSIRSLESYIGVDLVLRSSSGSHLTRAGSAFLNEAQRILAALDSAVVTARASSIEDSEPFRLGVSADIATGQTMNILQAFSRKTDCRIAVCDDSPSHLLSMLDDGRLDLLLIPSSTNRSSVAIEKLWIEEIHVALAANHRLAQKVAVDICSLSDELIVIGPRDRDSIADLFFNACRISGINLSRVAALLHQEVRLALVGAGIGVTVQAASNQCFFAVTRIVTRPTVPPLSIEIAAAWPRSGMSSLAQQFIEIAHLSKSNHESIISP